MLFNSRYDDNQKYIDSINLIKTNIKNNLGAKKTFSVLITSAKRNEGKTTVAMRLALSFAKENKKVLLMDCDLKNSNLKALIKGTYEGKGLSEIIMNRDGILENIYKYNNNLDILFAGECEDNTLEVLENSRIDEILHKFNQKYEYIIIDSTALVNIADARVLLPKVDGIVLVAKYNTTRRRDILNCKRILDKYKERVLGVVINMNKWGN